MLSGRLKSEMDRSITRLARHPVFEAIAGGAITPRRWLFYLKSLEFMMRSIVSRLEAAVKVCDAAGRREFSVYFHAKWLEERGHWLWARDDAERLSRRFGLDPDISPSAALRTMTARDARLAETRPSLLVPHFVFLEYLTVELGRSGVECLVERNGIPRDCVTVLERHVELDTEHAAEGFQEIDRLLEESDFDALREVLLETEVLAAEFFSEVLACGSVFEIAAADARDAL